MNEGLIVIRYENCELKVLRNCRIDGRYKFHSSTRQEDHEKITSLDELYAKLTIGAVRLQADLAAAGAISLDTVLIGNYQSDRSDYRHADLEGRCEGATHVVDSAQVGAFVLASGASHEGGGHGDAVVAGAGLQHTSAHDILRQGGDMAKCESTQSDADVPPPGCGAIVRLELAPLQLAPGQRSSSAPANRLIVAGSAVLGLGMLAGGGLLAGGLAVGSDVRQRIGMTLGDDRIDLIERGNRANALAYTGAAIMGGSLLVGSILLILGRKQQDRMRVSPWSSSRSTGLALEFYF